MKAVLQTIGGGGSGYGISFWKMWMVCVMRAHLAELAMVEARKRKEPIKMPAKKALVTGTVAHGFLELYYKLAMKNALKALKLNTLAVSFVDDAGDPLDVAEDGRLEGERIFRAYRSVYPPDELGEIVEVEKRYEGPVIEKAVGISPFTFKPDMAICLDTSDTKRLVKTRRIKIAQGYWLVDHKTSGEREWTDRMFMDEVQFIAYCVAWQALYPKRELNGLLVNVLPKTKRPEFRTLVVPFPSPKRQQVLFNFLRQAQEKRAFAEEQFLKANITQCYNPEPCAFLGVCDRAA
jgi:hypothetical protein